MYFVSSKKSLFDLPKCDTFMPFHRKFSSFHFHIYFFFSFSCFNTIFCFWPFLFAFNSPAVSDPLTWYQKRADGKKALNEFRRDFNFFPSFSAHSLRVAACQPQMKMAISCQIEINLTISTAYEVNFFQKRNEMTHFSASQQNKLRNYLRNKLLIIHSMQLKLLKLRASIDEKLFSVRRGKDFSIFIFIVYDRALS